MVEPSRNDEIAEQLVENDIKVIDNHYKIPLPLNMKVVKQLPNNYQSALNRAMIMHCSALKNLGLKKC